MITKEIAKQFYRGLIKTKPLPSINCTQEEASIFIEQGLLSSKPFFCGRLGSTELQTIIFSEKTKHCPYNIFLNPFWKEVLRTIHNSSGVFNADRTVIRNFSDLYKSLMPEMDILGSWHSSESFFHKELLGIPRIKLAHIGPDIENDSWLKVLSGKKVLVVHPFTETIKKQYGRRNLLFRYPNILPEFKELILLRPIQSLGVIPAKFENWFDALYYMKHKMDTIDYDIALIGCGAYGFPLSAWAKQSGKKVILMGGALQLLFGIKGKRWADEKSDIKYIMENNPYWTYPLNEDIPEYDEHNPYQALRNYIK
jgi:hypothetical protein